MINIPASALQKSLNNTLPDNQLPEQGAFDSILRQSHTAAPESSADSAADAPLHRCPEEEANTGELGIYCHSHRQSGDQTGADAPGMESKGEYIRERTAVHDRVQAEGESSLWENLQEDGSEPVMNPGERASAGRTREDARPVNNPSGDREESELVGRAAPGQGDNINAGTAMPHRAHNASGPEDFDGASYGEKTHEEPPAQSGDIYPGESSVPSREHIQNDTGDKKIPGEIKQVPVAEVKTLSPDFQQQIGGTEKSRLRVVPDHDVKTHSLQSSSSKGEGDVEGEAETEISFPLRQKAEKSDAVKEMTADGSGESGHRDHASRKNSLRVIRESDTQGETARHGASNGEKKHSGDLNIAAESIQKTESTDPIHRYFTPSLPGKLDPERGISEHISNAAKTQFHSPDEPDSPPVHHLERGISSLEGGKPLANIHGIQASKADAFRELLNSIVYVAKGSARLGVTLDHDRLGRLNISVSMEKGLLNVHIDTADRAVRELIENNASTLVDALNEDGLSVGEFSIALKGRHDGREEPALLTGKQREETADEDVHEHSGSGSINIFA